MPAETAKLVSSPRWVALGIVLVQFLLTVAVAAIMYINGEHARRRCAPLRISACGAKRGEQSVRLAGQAIRSVALGVVVTALAQSILGGPWNSAHRRFRSPRCLRR